MLSTALKAALLSFIGVTAVFALDEGERIYKNVQGNYVIEYKGAGDRPARTVVEPDTKIDPSLRSSFVLPRGGALTYQYEIRNSSDSQQAIWDFRLDPVINLRTRREAVRKPEDLNQPLEVWSDQQDACEESMVGPQDWKGKICTFTRLGIPPGLNISWTVRPSLEPQAMIPPGSTRNEFGFISDALPGIIVGRVSGFNKQWREGRDPRGGGFRKEDDFEISADLHDLINDMLEKETYGVARWTAVPTFEIPTPFVPSALLQAIRDHVAQWPGKNLMTADFNGQVLGLMDQALSAYQSNDEVTARRHLKSIRSLLRASFPNLQTPIPTDGTPANDHHLAARVLDFNVKYFIPNEPPVCTAAVANPASLWPPNHAMTSVSISGVTDPENGPVTITVDAVSQDEPVNGQGDGDAAPDAILQQGRASLRSERKGSGNGRVYHLRFSAMDVEGDSCTGIVKVCVPQSQKKSCVDDGQKFNSEQR